MDSLQQLYRVVSMFLQLLAKLHVKIASILKKLSRHHPLSFIAKYIFIFLKISLLPNK